jgi:hypothetical protein
MGWRHACALVAAAMFGIATAQAADFGFAFDNVEQHLAKAQEVAKIDLGLEKLKCYGDDKGKGRACSFKTKVGGVLIVGAKDTQVDSIVAALDKPGLKAGLRVIAVSAIAIGLGRDVKDKGEFRKGLDAAIDSYVEQIQKNAGAAKYEVSIGAYKWTLFRVSPDKDEMFVSVAN